MAAHVKLGVLIDGPRRYHSALMAEIERRLLAAVASQLAQCGPLTRWHVRRRITAIARRRAARRVSPWAL